jgi:hypothetical protein
VGSGHFGQQGVLVGLQVAPCVLGILKMAPGAARDPATYEDAVLEARELVQLDDVKSLEAAAASLIYFDAYPRSQALLSLKKSEVTRCDDKVIVTFFPSADEASSKTNARGDAVVIGDNPSRGRIASVVLALKSRSTNSNRMFSIAMPQYSGLYKKGRVLAGLQHLKHTAHTLRHGGASEDDLDGKPRSYIKQRGGWRRAKSCERYRRRGRYLCVLNKLTPAQMKTSKMAEQYLEQNLSRMLRKLLLLKREMIDSRDASTVWTPRKFKEA